MLKRKQAQRVARYFEKLIVRVEDAPTKEALIMNITRAEEFLKALKLTKAIDRFTSDDMEESILEAEQEAYKKINRPHGTTLDG